jgi:hypothetical protein
MYALGYNCHKLGEPFLKSGKVEKDLRNLTSTRRLSNELRLHGY